MKDAPRKIFVDTNIWIDYYLDRNRHAHEVASSLVAEALARGAVLYTSTAALSDIFFILCQETKRLLRKDGVTIDSGMVAAVRESAWATLRSLMELSILVPVSKSETLRAMTYRPLHDDFEDDLVLAAAVRADVDCVVTADVSLVKHAPLACLTPEDLLALLRSAQ